MNKLHIPAAVFVTMSQLHIQTKKKYLKRYLKNPNYLLNSLNSEYFINAFANGF